MPLRNNKKWKYLAQQKKKMAAKLMSISLKTDDYIYNHKPITFDEAQKYVEEMASLKSRCHDERYLQVIEKLTSYMKCIIDEQLPKHNDIDDDENSIKEMLYDKNNKPPLQISIKNPQVHNNISESYRSENVHIEIEKNVCNLSINDIENKTESVIDINITENYLEVVKEQDIPSKEKNYNAMDTNDDQNNNMTSRSNIENNVGETNIECRFIQTEKSITSKPLSGITNDKHFTNDNSDICSQNILCNYEYLLNTPENNQIFNKINHNQHKEQTSVISMENNIDTLTINPSTSQVKAIKRNSKQPKAKTTNKIEINSKKARKRIRNGTINTKHSSNNTINYTNEKHPNATLDYNWTELDVKLNNKSELKPKTMPKKTKIIDLSWVENIKFVREIDTQEYTTLNNIKDTFWNDMSLPPGMNSSDFEYDSIHIWKN